jgi:hypothetical protein
MAFQHWLRKNGALQPDNAEWPVVFEGGSRGVKARTPISADEILFAIPECLLLRSSAAQEGFLQKFLCEKGACSAVALQGADDAILMVTVFLFEYLKGSQGFWWPYFCTLPGPRSFATMLCQWPLRALDNLQDPLLAQQAHADSGRVVSAYTEYLRLIGLPGLSHAQQRVDTDSPNGSPYLTPPKPIDPTKLTMRLEVAAAAMLSSVGLAEFRWAWLTILSRCFNHPARCGGFVLAPWADLYNHQPSVPVETFSWESGDEVGPTLTHSTRDGGECNAGGQHFFTARAPSRVAAGQEIFVSYGKRPNEELLRTYGFVCYENQHERVRYPSIAVSLYCEQTVKARSVGAESGGRVFTAHMAGDEDSLEALLGVQYGIRIATGGGEGSGGYQGGTVKATDAGSARFLCLEQLLVSLPTFPSTLAQDQLHWHATSKRRALLADRAHADRAHRRHCALSPSDVHAIAASSVIVLAATVPATVSFLTPSVTAAVVVIAAGACIVAVALVYGVGVSKVWPGPRWISRLERLLPPHPWCWCTGAADTTAGAENVDRRLKLELFALALAYRMSRKRIVGSQLECIQKELSQMCTQCVTRRMMCCEEKNKTVETSQVYQPMELGGLMG